MGLMDKLGETFRDLLFVPEAQEHSSAEEDHATAKAEVKPENKPQAKETPPPMRADMTASSDSVDKYRKVLLDSIQKGKQPTEVICLPFMKTLKSLEPTITDETTRFKVAFTSGEVFGINAKSVVASCESLKVSLSEEDKKFNQTLEREAVSKVKQEEAEVADIDKSLEEKNATIQKLLKEIEFLKNDKTSKLSEINEARIKIDSIKRDFSQAVHFLLNEFDGIIQKINIYGGASDGNK